MAGTPAAWQRSASSYFSRVCVHASISPVQLLLVLDAAVGGGEAGSARPLRVAHHAREGAPLLVVAADDGAPVVVAAGRGAVGVVRGDHRAAVVVEARRPRPMRAVAGREALAAHRPAVDRRVEDRRPGERESAADLREVDVLAAAGHVAVVQRGHDRDRAVDASRVIEVGPAPTGRRLARQPGEERHAGERLRARPVRAVGVIAAGVSEGGERDVDDVRLDRAQLLVAQLPALHHPRSEVLDHHVRDRDQPLQQLAAARVAEVERDAALVDVLLAEPVAVIEVRLDVLGPARVRVAIVVVNGARRRPLHLDHLGAERAEDARAPGARPHPAEIDDPNALEGARAAAGRLP